MQACQRRDEAWKPYAAPMGLIVRILGYAAGLALAAWALAGVNFNGEVLGSSDPSAKVLPVLSVALILAGVNTIVRPVAKMFVFPLILLTMGLFLLVINAGMLMLTALIAEAIELNFQVVDFESALIGSVIVTFVAFVVDLVLANE